MSNDVIEIGHYAFFNCSLIDICIPSNVIKIGNYAFSDCRLLTNITYNGTISQWKSISKGAWWDRDSGKYTIHCTDGDITKYDPTVQYNPNAVTSSLSTLSYTKSENQSPISPITLKPHNSFDNIQTKYKPTYTPTSTQSETNNNYNSSSSHKSTNENKPQKTTLAHPVLFVLSFLTGPLGIIFFITWIIKCKKDGAKIGKVLAIIGGIYIVVTIIVLIIVNVT